MLLLPVFYRTDKIKWKSSWVEIRTGWSLVKQNRLKLRKIGLILLLIKIDLDGKKRWQTLKHLPPYSPLSETQLHSLPPNSSTSSPCSWAVQGNTDGRLWLVHTLHLCYSLLLTVFPAPARVLPTGCSPSSTAPVWASGKPAPEWVFHGLRGVPAWAPWAPPALFLVSAGLFLTRFPFASHCRTTFSPFRPEVPSPWLRRSAVPHTAGQSDPAGAGCVRHGAAPAAPHSGHPCSPPLRATQHPQSVQLCAF